MSWRILSLFFKRLSIASIFLLSMNCFADGYEASCGGAGALLSLTDAGGNSESPCVVPEKQLLIEASYLYQSLYPVGEQQIYPIADVRLGLPQKFELGYFVPNYYQQTLYPRSGFANGNLSLKKAIAYNDSYLFSAQLVLSPPGGSKGFGAAGTGAAINSLFNYNFTEQYSLLLQLGLSTATESKFFGSGRYNSINPDVVFTYTPTEKLNFFAEVFGQSKTAPRLGAGFNSDYGVLILLRKNFLIDINYGRRISGELNNLNQFITAGFSIQLS